MSQRNLHLFTSDNDKLNEDKMEENNEIDHKNTEITDDNAQYEDIYLRLLNVER